MDLDLAQSAIALALSGKWKEAIEKNKLLLAENPKDVDALNRIARAYAEVGNLKKARTHAQKALKLDPFNRIAQKALKKWEGLKSFDIAESTGNGYAHSAFLEEPGKTTITTLLFPGEAKVIARLNCGDEVNMSATNHRVNVETRDGKYIGRLADDLSARLRKLVSSGNEYRAFVKSLDETNVKVFISESRRSQSLADKPSFPVEKLEYASFTPPELVHKKERVNLTQEEES